jgi:hypothetical protein
MDGYVDFEKMGTTKSGKTDIYEVQSRIGKDFLGEVKWHAPWRRYVFCPDAECKFDESCLREIANFCADLMSKRKA